MSSTVFKRPLSYSERLYLVGQTLCPPFCIQLVLEGEGGFEWSRLCKALEKAGHANPGCRLVLKRNAWGAYFWQDNQIAPPLRKQTWTAELWQDAAYQTPLSTSGPCAEVVWETSENTKRTRLVFRAFHGIMDARGLLFWAEEVLRAYRDEPLRGQATPLTDESLLKELGASVRQPLAQDCPAPTGLPQGTEAGYRWGHIRIPRHLPGLNAYLALIIAKAVWQTAEGPVRFMMPVDLRSRCEDLFSTANLSSPLFIPVEPDAHWSQVYQEILHQLASQQEVALGLGDRWIHYLPLPLIQAGVETLIRRQNQTHRYLFSGLLSHVGRLEWAPFTTPEFRPQHLYLLPFNSPIFPLSIVALETPNTTEIALSIPQNLGNSGRFETLLNTIKNALLEANLNHRLQLTPAFQEYLEAFNQTKTETLAPDTLFARLAEQVAESPERVALICQQEHLSYARLLQDAELWAKRLQAAGIQKGDRVALLLPRSFALVTAIWAILKLGAVFIPIDLLYPLRRIAHIVSDAQAKVLICLPEQAAVVHSLPAEILLWETQNTHDIAQVEITEHIEPDADAYIIYTSGSTGQPKGVCISHRSLLNYLDWARICYFPEHINGQTIHMPLFTSPAFDLTLTTLFLPLLNGQTLDIYSETDPVLNLQAILKSSAHIMKLTPSHLQLLLQLIGQNTCLQTLIVGGENLTTALAMAVAQKIPGVQIFNEYGPTEATIGCMVHAFTAQDDRENVALGRPVANTQIFVLANDLQPVGPGEIGEIYIGGLGLGRYINLSEAGYIPSIFHSGQRLYRTGDLARWDEQGRLFFLGRRDQQMKWRGYRIEPGEIEAVLRKDKAIQDVTVQLRTLGQSQTLVAYLILQKRADLRQPETEPDEVVVQRWRQLVLDYLPHYMLPAHWMTLSQFPLNAHGKLAIQHLPLPDFQPETPHVSVFPPTPSNLENKLRSLWAQILYCNAQDIQAQSSFYALGGDSLKLLALVDQIETRLLNPKQGNILKKRLVNLVNQPTFQAWLTEIQMIQRHDES